MQLLTTLDNDQEEGEDWYPKGYAKSVANQAQEKTQE